MIDKAAKIAEDEYEMPLRQIIKGYAKDGEPEFRTAEILHLELPALRHSAAATGIEFSAPTPISREEQSTETRSRISRSKRLASPSRYQFQGLELSLTEWAERTGISMDTIRVRMNRGWDTARALTTPTMDKHQIAMTGVNARRRA